MGLSGKYLQVWTIWPDKYRFMMHVYEHSLPTDLMGTAEKAVFLHGSRKCISADSATGATACQGCSLGSLAVSADTNCSRTEHPYVPYVGIWLSAYRNAVK